MQYIWLVLIGELHEGASRIRVCASEGVAQMVAEDHRKATTGYYEWKEVGERSWMKGCDTLDIVKQEVISTYTPKL